MKQAIIMIIILIGLTGCTYSINMAHTQGTASDLIDETDSVTPSTTLTVPVSALP